LACALLIFLGPILFAWTILKFAAWYVSKIPENKLPLTGYWQGWNPRFYIWLNSFLDYWANGLRFWSALFFLGGLILTDFFGLNSFWVFFVASLVMLYFYRSAFLNAKMYYWDAYVWQAEPAAQILVGSAEEYSKLSEEDKAKVKRHIADVQIGINKGSWLVSGGKARVINPPSGILARFGGPGILVVQEGHAVVTERSGMISHIVGSGKPHYLAPFETVSQVIYLGMQRGAFVFEHVITKDRIVIDKMHVNVFYKVDPGRRTRQSGIYSFDRTVIIEKIWSVKSIITEDKSANLEGGVFAVANTIVRDTIADYDLQEIITATGTIRAELRLKLRDAIQAVTQNAMGILTPIVDIGEIIFPDDARKKLLERWKIDWQVQIDRIVAEANKQTKIIEAQARQVAEESEAAIARIRAETKKHEMFAEAEARQQTLAAEAAIAASNLEIKRQEVIVNAQARQAAEESEAAIARVRAETKKFEMLAEAQGRRDAAIANADAAYQAMIAEAEAKRQARIKAGEGEREYQILIGKGKAAAKQEEGLADAEVEAEKLRQAAAAVSHLDAEMARLVLHVYGNTQSRRIMARLTRRLENAEAVDKELGKTAGDGQNSE
jgi:regulator of protease activity HflC (stomatin/prohibitin superfamily)